MAETVGAAKKPRQKTKSERDAEAAAASNVVDFAPIPNEDQEAALRSKLLTGVSDLRTLDEKIAAAMSKVKALRADRKTVVAKLGAAGLPASLVAEAMTDADNTRTDLAEKERARDRAAEVEELVSVVRPRLHGRGRPFVGADMTKAAPSYQTWLARRIAEADKWQGESRAKEYARVRASIEGFKARNLDDLGPGFFDAMLAELDKAAGVTKPQTPKPVEAGAFD